MADLLSEVHYYVHYDLGTGKVKGLYDTQTSPTVPYPSLEVSYDVYDGVVRQQNKGKVVYVVSGRLEFRDTIYNTLDLAKRSKLNEINLKADEALSKVTSIYPVMEIVSWYKQEIEAMQYRKDPTYPTPMTDAIALYRGIDKEILVDRIIEKARLFAQISGATFGRRQGLEDRLQKAKTVDDVKAITVDYSDISSQIPNDIWQYN
jgi:hypothetical protein